MSNLRTNRMTTAVERTFRRMPNGYFREITLHFINFLNEDGSVKSSKLDQQLEGNLYRVATGNERSMHGEVEYTFPGESEPTRLVCIGDESQFRYGRG